MYVNIVVPRFARGLHNERSKPLELSKLIPRRPIRLQLIDFVTQFQLRLPNESVIVTHRSTELMIARRRNERHQSRDTKMRAVERWCE